MMKRNIIVAVFALLGVPLCIAQGATPEATADLFARAWTAHDMAMFNSIFTDDVRFIPNYDVMNEGRERVVADLDAGLSGWARGSTLTTSKVSVQQISADTAVVHLNVSVSPPAGVDFPPLGRTLMLVVVKQPDGWRIATGQLTKPAN